MAEGLEDRSLMSVGLDSTWGFGGVSQLNVPTSNVINGFSQHFDAIALQNGQVVEVGALTTTPFAPGPTSTTNLIVARLTTGGFIDTTFGTNGVTTLPLTFGGVTYTVNSFSTKDIAVQSNGSIDILATATAPGSNGTTTEQFLVAQLTPSGALDTSFGTSGFRLIDFGTTTSPSFSAAAEALAIGPDGKIIAAGNASTSTSNGEVFAVARLTATGALDTSFNTTGTATIAIPLPLTVTTNSDTVSAVTVQSDNKIVVAGSAELPTTSDFTNGRPSDVAVVRFNDSGTPDNSFNGSGTLAFNQNLGGNPSSDGSSAVTLSGTQIVIAGTSRITAVSSGGTGFVSRVNDLTVTRLNSNGSFDTTFAGNGKFVLTLTQQGTTFNTTGASVIARPSGALIVGGSANEQNTGGGYYGGGGPNGALLLSLTPTGTPDPTFGTNGAALIGEAYVSSRLLEQTDGKFLFIAGGSNVARTTAPTPAVVTPTITTTPNGKKATGLSIVFNTAVNPNLLSNVSIYQIRAVKGRKVINIKKKGISYNATTQTLTLKFSQKVAIGKGFVIQFLTTGIVSADGPILPTTPILITKTM